MIVFSVVNADYLLLAKEWARRVLAACGREVVFACADGQSLEHLQSLGFSCLDYSRVDHLRDSSYRSLVFPSKHAAFTSSLKFRAALSFVEAGHDCVYSDVDALWLRDPWLHLQETFDIAFQAGSFPEAAKEQWGFAACAGFMAFRASNKVESFVAEVIQLLDGSDQRALNQLMLDACRVHWQRRPVDWEHCAIEGGWTSPILGKCSVRGLAFLALPHVYFQRHNVVRENLEQAVVCHPNAPKNQAEKIEIFRALGLWDN
jgi:hypothetical protein